MGDVGGRAAIPAFLLLLTIAPVLLKFSLRQRRVARMFLVTAIGATFAARAFLPSGGRFAVVSGAACFAGLLFDLCLYCSPASRSPVRLCLVFGLAGWGAMSLGARHTAGLITYPLLLAVQLIVFSIAWNSSRRFRRAGFARGRDRALGLVPVAWLLFEVVRYEPDLSWSAARLQELLWAAWCLKMAATAPLVLNWRQRRFRFWWRRTSWEGLVHESANAAAHMLMCAERGLERPADAAVALSLIRDYSRSLLTDLENLERGRLAAARLVAHAFRRDKVGFSLTPSCALRVDRSGARLFSLLHAFAVGPGLRALSVESISGDERTVGALRVVGVFSGRVWAAVALVRLRLLRGVVVVRKRADIECILIENLPTLNR